MITGESTPVKKIEGAPGDRRNGQWSRDRCACRSPAPASRPRSPGSCGWSSRRRRPGREPRPWPTARRSGSPSSAVVAGAVTFVVWMAVRRRSRVRRRATGHRAGDRVPARAWAGRAAGHRDLDDARREGWAPGARPTRPRGGAEPDDQSSSTRPGRSRAARFGVVGIATAGGFTDVEALRLAAAVEQDSEHTIAQGDCPIAPGSAGSTFPAAEGFRAIPGVGVSAGVEGRSLADGRPRASQGALRRRSRSLAQSGRPGGRPRPDGRLPGRRGPHRAGRRGTRHVHRGRRGATRIQGRRAASCTLSTSRSSC